ncbi:MAG: LEA type 2 family protein [Desulfosarcina sp.]|nr:LEA type 2 family protein [Desulfosarcina sp.]
MYRRTRTLIVYAALLMITGCATLHPDFETPTVTVTAIRALPSESIAPRFEIDLQIINPNRTALNLHGIAYSLKLEGYKILTGVANDLPIIDGYSEGDVTLIATTSLLSSIRFFADLMNAQRGAIAYELEAKLDLGGFRPNIHVGEKGEINLSGPTH